MKSILSILFVIFIANATPSEIYVIDPAQSSLTWTGYYLFSFGEHYGTLSISKGEIELQAQEITKAFFEIDMTSITNKDMQADNGGDDLVNHLKSDDFFAVHKFPTATFQLTKATRIKDAAEGQPNYDLIGNLTLKGKTNAISFPVNITFENESIEAVAKFKFDRTKWDVHYNSGKFFSDVGDGAISDAIGVEFKIRATKK